MMDSFEDLTPEQALSMMESEDAVLLDIRDNERFNLSHPKGAFHLTNQSYGHFQNQYDYTQPIIVSCYHGVSSRNIAHFLIEQGYEKVYNLSGGFAGWVNAGLPVESTLDN